MIEQSGNAITAYAFYVASKVGVSGLTVTCDVFKRTASATTRIVSAAAASELDATNAAGVYYYKAAANLIDAEAEYIYLFKTATTTVDQRHIPTVWVVGKAGVEDLDAAITSRISLSDTLTELAAVPGAAPTVGQALQFLFMALRNKLTTTRSALKIHNDAGTAIGTSTLSDDDTTFTRNKMS